jgi:hypothetical protein
MSTIERISRFFEELTFPRACYILVGAVLVSCALGIAIGNRYVTPALNLVVVAPFYLWAAVRGRYGPAVGLSVLWLACTALFFTVGTTLFPERAGGAVLYGEAFNADFNRWLAGENVAFGVVWDYLGKAAVQGGFTGALSLLTGGLGGLLVGSVNVTCISYNAGRLVLGSTDGTLSILFAWPFWEVLKAISLINLSVAFGVPVIRTVSRRRVIYKTALEHAAAGLLFLGTSVFIHWRAALFWRDVLADITIIG